MLARRRHPQSCGGLKRPVRRCVATVARPGARRRGWSLRSGIDDKGNFLGSVSGGCVEGAVVTEAMDVIESGKPKTLEFGVADETAWKVGLSCGGTIRVFVEKVE